MSISILLTIIGSAIVVVLGVYAYTLMAKVKQQKRQQDNVRSKRVASMQSSIQTIAFAMQQQQCDLSEGVIRICRLLEAMPVNPHPDYANEFPFTHELFNKVKSYPTHEARAVLTKLERREQDKERQELESLLESKILIETEALRKLEVV